MPTHRRPPAVRTCNSSPPTSTPRPLPHKDMPPPSSPCLPSPFFGNLLCVAPPPPSSSLQVNDGSNMSGIQVVVEPGVEGWSLVEEGAISTGADTDQRAHGAWFVCVGGGRRAHSEGGGVEHRKFLAGALCAVVGGKGRWRRVVTTGSRCWTCCSILGKLEAQQSVAYCAVQIAQGAAAAPSAGSSLCYPRCQSAVHQPSTVLSAAELPRSIWLSSKLQIVAGSMPSISPVCLINVLLAYCAVIP